MAPLQGGIMTATWFSPALHLVWKWVVVSPASHVDDESLETFAVSGYSEKSVSDQWWTTVGVVRDKNVRCLKGF